jgi:hypothetical protein
MNLKILYADIEEVYKLIRNDSRAGVLKYENSYLKFQDTPISNQKRVISGIEIIRKEKKIEILFEKKKTLLACLILHCEYLLNSDYINTIEFNNNTFEDDSTYEDVFNKVVKDNVFAIDYLTVEDAIMTSSNIYYLVTPYMHDNYYFNQEYKRIKR